MRHPLRLHGGWSPPCREQPLQLLTQAEASLLLCQHRTLTALLLGLSTAPWPLTQEYRRHGCVAVVLRSLLCFRASPEQLLAGHSCRLLRGTQECQRGSGRQRRAHTPLWALRLACHRAHMAQSPGLSHKQIRMMG